MTSTAASSAWLTPSRRSPPQQRREPPSRHDRDGEEERSSGRRATRSAPGRRRREAVPAAATTTDRTRMPITSSMTAAPRMVDPSRVRSAPSSMSVCAEMLTLVAVRTVPMKTPSQNTGRPNAAAVAMPPKNGNTTPPKADQKATVPTRRISSRSVSRPATNIRRRTPISARSRISDEPRSPLPAKIGQASRSSSVGPSRRPTRISPNTAGWPMRAASRAGRLGGRDHQRQEQQDLQGVGHLSFTLLGSGFPVRVQVRGSPRSPVRLKPDTTTGWRGDENVARDCTSSPPSGGPVLPSRGPNIEP